MIGRLTGTVVHAEEGLVFLDVSGVGYKIYVSADTFAEVKDAKESINLWTHLAVRENALDVYGFLNKEELEFFELLITISGVGPKSALGILSVASVETLQSAIVSGDTSYLTKVSGIGKKSAEKIVLMLKDKIGALENFGGDGARKDEVDALEALRALGYSTNEAREALKSVSNKITGTNERIREALKHLGI